MLLFAAEPMFVNDVAADQLNRNVNEFGNLELDCNHTCRPSPSITWRLNGAILPNFNGSSTISLSNVAIQDGSHYDCTVVNELAANTRVCNYCCWNGHLPVCLITK